MKRKSDKQKERDKKGKERINYYQLKKEKLKKIKIEKEAAGTITYWEKIEDDKGNGDWVECEYVRKK